MGVGIEVTNLNAWYGTNHTRCRISIWNIPANYATALSWPFGLRQKHLCSLPQPHARDNPIARVTGNVRMGDLDIYQDASPVEVRRRVGMVFQRPNPFPHHVHL